MTLYDTLSTFMMNLAKLDLYLHRYYTPSQQILNFSDHDSAIIGEHRLARFIVTNNLQLEFFYFINYLF